jgi:hypothetical protein
LRAGVAGDTPADAGGAFAFERSARRQQSALTMQRADTSLNVGDLCFERAALRHGERAEARELIDQFVISVPYVRRDRRG